MGCWLFAQGVEVGRSEMVLHVRPCEGLMRQLDGTIEKRFAKKEILYPLQVYPLWYMGTQAAARLHSRYSGPQVTLKPASDVVNCREGGALCCEGSSLVC